LRHCRRRRRRSSTHPYPDPPTIRHLAAYTTRRHRFAASACGAGHLTRRATVGGVTTAQDDTPHWVLTLSCPDRPGIVHAVAGAIAATGGNITESQQYGDPETGLFFMRVEVQADVNQRQLEQALAPVASQFGMRWHVDEAGRPMRTLVLGSTTEHCVGDLLFQQQAHRLPVDIRAIASNHTVLAPLAQFYGVD